MKNFTKAVILLCSCIAVSKVRANGNTPATESFRSNLYVVNTDNSLALADGNLAQYNNSYSAGVDFMDAAKLVNINETFGLLRDGVLLSIERRPIIGLADTLFFSLTKTIQRSYQFQFTTSLMNQPGLTGTLIDSYTGINTPVNLNGSTAVNFSVDANAGSQNATRFMVVFSTQSITPVSFSGITAWQQGADAEVSWAVDQQLNIKSYTIQRSADGINFTNVATVSAAGGNNASSKYSWIDATAVTGIYFYRVESTGTDGSVLYSHVVNVKIGKVNQSLTIFPNPVHGGIVGLHFKNMPQGVYNIRITSITGQEVGKKIISISGDDAAQSILLNKDINKGVYQMEVIAPDNTKTILKLLNN